MIATIWLRPVPSCCFVWNAADGGLHPKSTNGGRDKRRGAHGHYRVVVVGFFMRCMTRDSATTAAKALISNNFCRATLDFSGVTP